MSSVLISPEAREAERIRVLALLWVNRLRRHFRRAELELLPRGFRWHQQNCSLHRAMADLKLGTFGKGIAIKQRSIHGLSWWQASKIVRAWRLDWRAMKVSTEYGGWKVELPATLRRFNELLDDGCYPDLWIPDPAPRLIAV